MRVLARVLALVCLLIACTRAHAQVPNPFVFPHASSALPLTADFNGDGKPDLARGDGSIFLSNGDGTFSQGTTINLGKNVSFNIIATADFNGDGKPDLLAQTSTFFYVLLGNGDGTFQVTTPITTNIGTQIFSVVVADVNRDGKADVIGKSGSQLFVFLGRGDGTFGTATIYTPLANGFSGFTVADFNGDGKLDIAVDGDIANAIGPVGVMLGNGDGTFQTAKLSTGVNSPFGIAAGDFNGDGKIDLAVSGTNLSDFTEQTYILLGNGDGTFQAPGSPVPGNELVSTIDLNGDGKLDLVVWASPFIETFLGNGDGTFSPKATYVEPIEQLEGALAIADFNGGGKLDITDGNLMIFGKGDGSFQNVPALLLNVPEQFGPSLTSVAAGDFNGDGKSDLAVSLSGPNARIYILLGDGAGEFSVAHVYGLPTTPYSIQVADFNGDGKTDVFFTIIDPTAMTVGFDVMLGNGDGSFAAPVVSSMASQTTFNPVPLAIADLNGDHIPDIVANTNGQLAVLLGNGDGTFGAPVSYFAGSQPNSFVIGNFNNDGNPDVVSCSMAGIGVLLGKGDGTFLPATFPDPPPPPPTKYFMPTLQCLIQVAGDFNGDGITDLVVDQFETTSVLLGNGDGTFTTLPTPVPLNAVTVADINGDGKLDLVAPDGVTVSFGNGDGTFSGGTSLLPSWLAGETITETSFGPPPGPPIFVIADFTGDHLPDVALLVPIVPGGLITLPNTLPPPSPDFLVSAALVGGAGVVPGNSVGSEVTLTPVGTFSETVALSCSGLPAGASCSFAPSLLPGAAGKSALTITTAASTAVGTYPVSIVGTSTTLVHQRMVALTVAATAGATNANVLPGIFTFTQQISGTTSSAQMTTLTNTGSAALTIAAVSIAGANAGDFAVSSNTCGSSVAGYASCQISVTFTPTAMGARSATLSISDNATGSPQIVALNGTGQDFAVSAGATTSATVTAGQTATYMLSLGAGGGFSGNVTLSCTGAPATTTCSVLPGTVSVGGATAPTATVTVTTTARSEVPLPVGHDSPREFRSRPTVLLASLVAMLILAWTCITRKNPALRWAPVLTMVLVLVLGITLTSCGGGSSGGGGGTVVTGTRAGTYTITVSATATAGSTMLTHTTKLTLIVQ
jgi:FG-GAP-like repeat/Abnormal spindle-like microcephaly-assoc'd, ASPM-SPD-2-Hydin